MDNRTRAGAWKALIVITVIAVGVPVLLTGCGAQTPEAAVSNFYKSIESHNWNDYLNSVLPDNVRRATAEELRIQKEKFEDTEFKYVGLKFKTISDKKNKDKAEVELTGGAIKAKNPQTGKDETTTIAEIKKQYGVTPTLKAEKFKGEWYVDVPLAEADKPVQEQ